MVTLLLLASNFFGTFDLIIEGCGGIFITNIEELCTLGEERTVGK